MPARPRARWNTSRVITRITPARRGASPSSTSIPTSSCANCSTASFDRSLLRQSRLNRVNHPLFIRKLLGLELRVNELPVDRHLERAAAGWDQQQALEALLIFR